MARVGGPPELSRRLDQALELADIGVEIMRQNLRRRHPGASADDIERRLVAWQDRRPGAELGDCPGPLRSSS